METKRVRFLPYDVEILVPKGQNLLEAAITAGIYINASCGGQGTCGRCKVLIEKGEVETKRMEGLSEEEFNKGYRQACQTTILDDLEVSVPVESYLDKGVLERVRGRGIEGRSPSYQVLEDLIAAWCHDPVVHKYFIRVDPPSTGDTRSDLSRLLIPLKKALFRKLVEESPKGDLVDVLPSWREKAYIEPISVDFRVLRYLPRLLRESRWEVTVTVAHTRNHSYVGKHQLRGSRAPKLLFVESGDTTDKQYSIALDIGTTTVFGQLVDINEQRVLAESSDYNAQIAFGDDVITRIIYSQRSGGLKDLQNKVVSTINSIIKDLSVKTGIDTRFVSYMVTAGNTTMTHILLGLDPKYIRESPYTPVANYIPPVRAVNLGINVSEHVHMYTFPSVASYVGGDIVAGVLASGICRRKALTLYMDVGTNGEIVIGNSEWLMTASCSAGPAFEGSGIKHGMRATTGAIEDFRINPVSYEPMIITTGRVKPKGICGSGLISILAELLEAAVVDRGGKFNTNLPTKRVRNGVAGYEYVLVWADDTQIQKDIVITEADIENILRAKAAIYAGCVTLLETAGLKTSDLEQVVIAGAFGNFIDLKRSIAIGVLPELPLDRFLFVGNGSLLGAQALCLCKGMIDDAENIAKMMTNVELSEHHPFMERYVAALFLPHTNEAEFPETSHWLAGLQKRRAT